MIRKTAFLVTGTVTGLVAVLSYNPPDLNKAIAATSGQPLDSATPGGVATNSNTVTATPTPVTTTSSTTKTKSNLLQPHLNPLLRSRLQNQLVPLELSKVILRRPVGDQCR